MLFRCLFPVSPTLLSLADVGHALVDGLLAQVEGWIGVAGIGAAGGGVAVGGKLSAYRVALVSKINKESGVAGEGSERDGSIVPA